MGKYCGCRLQHGARHKGLLLFLIHCCHDMVRLWCRLTEWRPLRIEVVGHERIPGVARLDVKGYDGRHLPILPSDHYAVYAQFQLCSAAES